MPRGGGAARRLAASLLPPLSPGDLQQLQRPQLAYLDNILEGAAGILANSLGKNRGVWSD